MLLQDRGAQQSRPYIAAIYRGPSPPAAFCVRNHLRGSGSAKTSSVRRRGHMVVRALKSRVATKLCSPARSSMCVAPLAFRVAHPCSNRVADVQACGEGLQERPRIHWATPHGGVLTGAMPDVYLRCAAFQDTLRLHDCVCRLCSVPSVRIISGSASRIVSAKSTTTFAGSCCVSCLVGACAVAHYSFWSLLAIALAR